METLSKDKQTRARWSQAIVLKVAMISNISPGVMGNISSV